MTKTITIDTLSLTELSVVATGSGQYQVNAIYTLLSGSQVVLTLNQDVSAALDANAVAALGSAFTTVQTAIAAQVATL